MKTVSFSTLLNAPIEAVYAFHCDTNNLPKITPLWIKAQVVELVLPLQEGSVIVLDITRFGFTQRWKMEIERMQAPHVVVDRSLKSPFRVFHHEHAFEVVDKNTTKMRDTVSFSLPFEPLSKLVYPLVVWDLARMFAYRHQQTQKLLGRS